MTRQVLPHEVKALTESLPRWLKLAIHQCAVFSCACPSWVPWVIRSAPLWLCCEVVKHYASKI